MPTPMMTDLDIHLFREGTHARLYDCLGCHLAPGDKGAQFAVWAPNARAVSVIGDWNGWNAKADPLSPRPDGSGIWEGKAAGVRSGHGYKFRIESQAGGHVAEKADPFALLAECPPATASRAWALNYEWQDAQWMSTRARRNALDSPVSIYELHPGSWRRKDGAFLGYRELAHELAPYIREMGFTHVELMPVTEHPFYGSWGYQTTGYFAPTARYGTPQDFMYLVDHLHQNGIGVILDWVPSHIPTDVHGLAFFGGTYLYEHADPRQGFHPEWNSSIFNYGRNEVRAFLLSSALFWLDRSHLDGLRVDAVASMLYLDYAREPGEWIPNAHGGRENLGAIDFMRVLNTSVYRDHPDTMTVAEESTAWPMVSRPTYLGGLGFGMKWNMGWMHDTLAYLREDPVHRKFHHGRLTFSLIYAFNEIFVLPLSHDEVVYGKGSLSGKMPGDAWQQFAGLRALYGYMWAHPGKKLLFMGGELAQPGEWSESGSLGWEVLDLPGHAGVQALVRDLNAAYRDEPALWEADVSSSGFEWLVVDARDDNVLAFARRSAAGDRLLVCVVNLSPVVREGWTVPLPRGGRWREVLNTDSRFYGGSDVGNTGTVVAADVPLHGRPSQAALTLPPLGVVWLVPVD